MPFTFLRCSRAIRRAGCMPEPWKNTIMFPPYNFTLKAARFNWYILMSITNLFHEWSTATFLFSYSYPGKVSVSVRSVANCKGSTLGACKTVAPLHWLSVKLHELHKYTFIIFMSKISYPRLWSCLPGTLFLICKAENQYSTMIPGW